MSTKWVTRYYIIVPVMDRDAGNARARTIDPDTGGDKTFSNQNCSADGNPPATHTLVSTAAQGTMRQALGQLFADWAAAGLTEKPLYWQINAEAGTLTASNATRVTNQPWTVADTLAAAGLQMISETNTQPARSGT